MNKDNNIQKQENNSLKKKKIGTVVSDKMDKTVVVKVDRMKVHPKYKKRYQSSKKYKAHDEKNEFKVGDKVMIIESRPLSRHKNWVVVKIENKE